MNPEEKHPLALEIASTAYFMLVIILIGATAIFGLVVPLHLVASHLKFKPARRLADRLMIQCVKLLIYLQPWLTAQIQMASPEKLGLNLTSGVLMVSNHRSTLDPFLVLANVKGVRIFAKAPIFKVPFLGLVMRVSGHIPVERNHLDLFLKAIDQLRENLHNGETVFVFPEMTRCKPGFQGILDFNLAPFHAAFQEKTPVIPSVFTGTDQAWPKGYPWVRPGYQVTFRSLPPVFPKDYASASELRAEVHLRIAQALSEAQS